MSSLISDAVSNALPVPMDRDGVDRAALLAELEQVARQARQALDEGIPLCDAVLDPRFDALVSFHQDLRDSLFVELPRELRGWVEQSVADAGPHGELALGFVDALTELAREAGPANDPAAPLQRALAELLVFEGLRLRLLLMVWSS
ncbi:MAG: hypothetical protein KDK70_42170, partial [Myxococcales bacterium]|nr:hypothetical protein [Myxococcales bacterium]